MKEEYRKSRRKKRRLWGPAYGIILAAFTVYMILDTFVISRPMQTDATQMNLDLFSAAAQTAETAQSADTNETAETGETAVSKSASADLSEEALSKDSEETSQTSSDDTSNSRSSRQTAGSSSKSSGKHSSSHASKNASSHSEENSYEGSSAYSSGKSSETGDEDSSVQTAEISLETPLTYEDENISITVTEYMENGTSIYVADVEVVSAQYLKTAFAEDTYGRNVTAATSEIAQAHDAILAINGDYYGAQEDGYVIRNGIVYRSSGNGEDILCAYADGTLEIVDSSEITAEELVQNGVWQAWCFGPGLIEDGEIIVDENDEVGKAKSSNPRTAIGIIDENHYVFAVADGRTDEDGGLTLLELAQFLQELGAQTAYNLDGGGSSTMVFEGTVINNPTSGNSIKERSVSDIVYIG